MADPIIRFELDNTGTNPDNLVVGEPHALSDRPIRAIAPTYGPFFATSVKIYDTGSGLLLERGVHWQTAELLQDATLQYGKEICSIILIISPIVGSDVTIDYQVLGGYFTNDSTAIANLYTAVINDNRSVDWSNVNNKQLEYPPTLHRHLVEDVYGFEPVVVAIERLRNAILLTDVPAFEALLDEVHRQRGEVDCRSAMTNTPAPGVMTHWGFLASLTDKYLLGNLRFGYIPPELRKGSGIGIQIYAQDPNTNGLFYWSVIHDTTVGSDFVQQGGSFMMTDGVGQITIQLQNDLSHRPVSRFGIGLKTHPTDSDYMAVSCRVRVISQTGFDGYLPVRDIAVYPDLMSYWGEGMTPVNLFLSSAKDRPRLSGNSRGPEYTPIPSEIPIVYSISIYPDLMSYWGEDMTAANVFLGSGSST